MLVARYCQGLDAALNTLVVRYHGQLLNYATNYFRDGTAEDIVQDVWEAVVKELKAGHYSEQHQFRHWLFRLAHNHISDELRSRRKHPAEHLAEEDLDVLAEAVLPPETLHDRNMARQRLYQWLERLSPRYKEIIILRKIDEMSYEAISEKLHIEASTARSDCHKALEMLRKLHGIKAH